MVSLPYDINNGSLCLFNINNGSLCLFEINNGSLCLFDINNGSLHLFKTYFLFVYISVFVCVCWFMSLSSVQVLHKQPQYVWQQPFSSPTITSVQKYVHVWKWISKNVCALTNFKYVWLRLLLIFLETPLLLKHP